MPEFREGSDFKEEYYEVVWTGDEIQQFLENTGIDLAQFQQVMGSGLLRDLNISDVSSIIILVDKDDLSIFRIEFELEIHIVSVGFSKDYPDKPFYRVVSKVNPIRRLRIYLETLTQKTSQAEYVRDLLESLNNNDYCMSIVESIQAS